MMKKYLGTILLMVFMAPATFAQPQLPTAYEMYSIGIDYLKGINGKPMNYESAMNWFQAAAEQGYDYARTKIGIMYENGYGVSQDYVEAMGWYKAAGEESDALYRIGRLNYYGFGVPCNHSEAAKWYLKSAERDNILAQETLGIMYKNGDGVAQDYSEAMKWFMKGADGYKYKDEKCQFHVGEMYENGLGVPQNIVEAKKWYRKAAGQGYKIAQKALERLETTSKKPAQSASISSSQSQYSDIIYEAENVGFLRFDNNTGTPSIVQNNPANEDEAGYLSFFALLGAYNPSINYTFTSDMRTVLLLEGDDSEEGGLSIPSYSKGKYSLASLRPQNIWSEKTIGSNEYGVQIPVTFIITTDGYVVLCRDFSLTEVYPDLYKIKGTKRR